MASIQEVKSQIAQARKSVQEQRGLVEQKRKEAREVESKISEQERKLPKPTQSRLRSGLYSGLEGRKRRQQISGMKQELQTKKKDVGLFKKGLSGYEKEVLDPYEKEISKTEVEINKAAKYQEAVKVYLGLKTRPSGFNEHDPLVKKAKREAERIEGSQTQVSFSTPQSPQLETPSINYSPMSFSQGTADKSTFQKVHEAVFSAGEKVGDVIRDPTLLKGYLTTSRPEVVMDLDKGVMRSATGEDFGRDKTPSMPSGTPLPSITPSPSFSSPSFSVPRNLPLTDIRKDWQQLSSFDSGAVSTDKLFRTTGSPIRMTKLSSSKSRGYIPDRKPVLMRPYSFVKKPEISKTKKKKNKFEDDFFFGKSKGKKKSNIWGF